MQAGELSSGRAQTGRAGGGWAEIPASRRLEKILVAAWSLSMFACSVA